jgi:2-phospho-L-lactate transferase/gluconeogenesis factor (CofD/UPF0052 family)
VAEAYHDFLDILICDSRDARAADTLRKGGLRVQCTQTIMRTPEDKTALARETLSLVVSGMLSDEPRAAAASRSPDQHHSDQP